MTTLEYITPAPKLIPMTTLLDRYVPDPSGLAPLCDEAQFAAILDRMAANQAPRLFAVVQEYGNRVDGVIAAWGMAFPEYAEIVSVDGGLRLRLNTPENALPAFGYGSHVRARLVWLSPDVGGPSDE